MSKGVQIAIGALAVAGLLGWYGWTALEGIGTFQYYQTLGELRAAEVSGPIRVHGYVAEGSILRDLDARTVTFTVQETPPHATPDDAGTTLRVRYASLEVPDLFKDGAEVVLEGTLAPQAEELHATNVLAKCPSKFEAEETTQQASF